MAQTVAHLGRTVSVEFLTHQSAERLFDAFSPDSLSVWLAPEVARLTDRTVIRFSDGTEQIWRLTHSEPSEQLVFSCNQPSDDAQIEIRIRTKELRRMVQFRWSGFPLTQDFDEAVLLQTSRWQVRLAQLRHGLQQEFNAPPIHVRSQVLVAASAKDVFGYFVYPQWQAEWLQQIQLGRALASTRWDALYEWPLLRKRKAAESRWKFGRGTTCVWAPTRF
jgi:hypothetical protein